MHTLKRRWRTLQLAAACTIAAGCASVGPDFHAPAVASASNWSEQHGGDAGLAAPATAAAELPADPWAAFGDPLLAQLQADALAANADVRAAALRVLEARAEQRMATAQRAPTVVAQGAVKRQRQSENGAASRMVNALGGANSAPLLRLLSEPFTLYDAGFDASWELDLWGRVLRTGEAARASADAQAALLRQGRLGLKAEVARSYFQLRLAQRQERLLARQQADAAQGEALLQVQVGNGLADESALLRQRQQQAALAAALPALRAQQAQAMNQLTLLCALQPGALNERLQAGASDDEPGALPDLRLGLPADLARRRPDIAAAEARLHAATASVGLAVADLYPRIVLGASFGMESVGSDRFGDWGSRQWNVGPGLSLPLFDRGRRRTNVELRTLQQQEAAVAFQQTVLKSWHEVDDSLSAYSAEGQRVAQLGQRAQQAVAALHLAEERQRQGLSSALPVLAANATVLDAQRDLEEARTRERIALVAVYKALGGE
jgi:NodT family efflux transporter outer membrane factor (OMF) lipoprotein